MYYDIIVYTAIAYSNIKAWHKVRLKLNVIGPELDVVERTCSGKGSSSVAFDGCSLA